ncbi:mediator complex subunit 2-domain-containing protein [Scheffersomyces amazonensis]|uniref:mediator complex subunit 2-domain-containing protein n=1 Tax=Scheffersomyces amazonensis TaxID=1078765 RepID=UPI00315CAA15
MNLQTKLNNSLNDVLKTSGYIFEIIGNNKKQSNLITGTNNQLISPAITAQLANSISKFDDILDETISKFNDARWCIDQIIENKQKQEELKLKEELERRKREEERQRLEEEERRIQEAKKKEEEAAAKLKAEKEAAEKQKAAEAAELKRKMEEQIKKAKEEEAQRKKLEEENKKREEQSNQDFGDLMSTNDFDFLGDINMNSGKDLLSSMGFSNDPPLTSVGGNNGNNDFNMDLGDLTGVALGVEPSNSGSNINTNAPPSGILDDNVGSINGGSGNSNNRNGEGDLEGVSGDLDLNMNNLLENDESILDGLNMSILEQGYDNNNAGALPNDEDFDVDNFLDQFGGAD